MSCGRLVFDTGPLSSFAVELGPGRMAGTSGLLVRAVRTGLLGPDGADRKFVRGHGPRLILLGLLHSGERLTEANVYTRRASSSRTGRANPSSRSSPSSTKVTPGGGARSATRSLTRTRPALAWAAIRAARFTVRPK
jgi:hypothetical protein